MTDRSLVKLSSVLAGGLFLAWGMGQGVAAVGLSLDREGGFREAKIGAPLSSFRGLAKLRTDKGIDYYKRQGDNLSHGKLQLESILYGFSGGGLNRIQLRTPTEKESRPCGENARFKALLRSIEAYSDVTLAYESRPITPLEQAANECRGYCAVAVYRAKKTQVRLKADEEDSQEETSRRVLTAEQLSAYLRQARAKLTPEGPPLQEALAAVRRQRLAQLQFPADGARIYEGADASIIGAKEVQIGRFDVITLKDVSLCYHVVEFSSAPPPSRPGGWAGKILEDVEKQKKETGAQKKP